jgi:hypothetical protein
MENGRGEKIPLINTGIGTESIDLHLNRLIPGGPRGRGGPGRLRARLSEAALTRTTPASTRNQLW